MDFATMGAHQVLPPSSEKEMHMTRAASVAVMSLFVTGLCVTPIALAASDQQNKMKACNEQANAKGLGEGKGDERKAFMKECLSAKPVTSGKTAQQEKMKACNQEAGDKKLKGDERKTFMSTCLSN
jgi:psiF repeat-containing protein